MLCKCAGSGTRQSDSLVQRSVSFLLSEDYEEALQATTRALELLPHNKQIRALHLEVDRIFNGSKDPTEQQEAETSEPDEKDKQASSATEEKAPEKEGLPESPAKKKPEKKKEK